MRVYELILFFFFLTSIIAGAQRTASYENYNLPVDTFLDGQDLNGGFEDGNVRLVNAYDPDWMFWSGFALSTMSDTISPGFINQYSSIKGQGAEHTDTYGVGYASSPIYLSLIDTSKSDRVIGFYISNSTYAYLSMSQGDQFAKKFGGPSGQDPDFFKLTVKAYRAGDFTTDSVEIFLADFRSQNSAEDFILKDWKYIDISHFSPHDSLEFSLTSTDVGSFGMNTPAYFCIDEIITLNDVVSTKSHESNNIRVFPNLSTGIVHWDLEHEVFYSLKIINGSGNIVYSNNRISQKGSVNISNLPRGNYYFQFVLDRFKATRKVVKI
jgi:hypothetical protein